MQSHIQIKTIVEYNTIIIAIKTSRIDDKIHAI